MHREYVNYIPDMDTVWILRVSPPVDDPFDGPMRVVKAVFQAFQDLVVPTQIEYVAFAASSPEDLLTEGKGYGDTEQVISGHYERENGITFAGFEKVLKGELDPTKPYRAITRISIDHCKTRLVLDGDSVDVSMDHEWYRVSDSSPGESYAPSDDPFSISVYSRQEKPDGPYSIFIRTYTDIWFEDSSRGAVNRRRFGAAMDRVGELLNVVGTEIDSARYPDSWLRKRGFSELLPE